ncbi:MAG TPA: hypothetical protein ENK91_12345 [Bacteroidetes bacterium]|nr:hypothetical protein [Bacteroidota bacterium]
MKIKITHEDIDNSLEYFEERQFSDSSEKEILSNFPEIWSYLTSSQFKVLSDDEYMILTFDILVILKILNDKLGDIQDITPDKIELFETKNWDNLEKLGNISLEEKMDKIFGKEYSELTDFIISSYTDEEGDDEIISLPAREIIFVTAKTIIDCFNE